MRTPRSVAQMSFAAGADVVFAVEEGFEYGSLWSRVRWSRNRRRSESTSCSILVPTDETSVFSQHGGRVIMLGGEPFAEDIVMWWNFIGRSHQEIVEFRPAWEGGIRDSHPLSAARRR